MACVFCQIINKEIAADIIYENAKFLVFKSIKPVAPVHILIIPKKHIPSAQHLKLEDKELIGELFLLVKKIAAKQNIGKKGYKLVFNVGKGGGQVINHLHLHLLGGWKTAKQRDIPTMP
jgi:histidine triad (HIT) family protein